MEFVCKRCQYTTNTKSRFITHITRKKPCEPLYSNIDRSDLIEELNHLNDFKPYGCDVCSARFSHKSGLYRHKAVHKEDSTQHSNAPEHSENTHHTSTSTSTITNTNNGSNTGSGVLVNGNNNDVTNSTTNNNITVNLNIFGYEDKEHLDMEFLTKCLKNVTANGIPDLIEKIHLNPNFPQNHNVRLKRIKPPSTMWIYVKDENTNKTVWKEENMNHVLDKLVRKGCDMMVLHNNRVVRLSVNDPNEKELSEIRSEGLCNIALKKRPIYNKIRENVLCKFKDSNNSSTSN